MPEPGDGSIAGDTDFLAPRGGGEGGTGLAGAERSSRHAKARDRESTREHSERCGHCGGETSLTFSVRGVLPNVVRPHACVRTVPCECVDGVLGLYAAGRCSLACGTSGRRYGLTPLQKVDSVSTHE